MKSIRLLIAASICATASVRAQTPDAASKTGAGAPKLTPEQTANIMKQLDQLEAQIGKNRGDTLGGAYARCSKAVAAGEKGALELYLECYKVEHFDRMNLKITDYQDWAKRNLDKHKDPEFLAALWLQLQYLVFSIQAQDAKDMGPIVASLQSYIPKLVSAVQGATTHTASGAVKDSDKGKKNSGGRSFGSGQFQQMLRQSVKNSEFAKAFLLDDFLRKEEWEYEPLAIGRIYDSIIFPYYLEKKPADLGAQWDARIKADLTLKQAVMSDAEYAIYYKEKYPALLWKRASYLYDHGVNPILAMADMLKVIRENPTHPDAGDWLKNLRGVVNGAQPSLLPSGSEKEKEDAADKPQTPPPPPAPNN